MKNIIKKLEYYIDEHNKLLKSENGLDEQSRLRITLIYGYVAGVQEAIREIKKFK
jgi:hypothetical protein